jgi:hypothetical protein
MSHLDPDGGSDSIARHQTGGVATQRLQRLAALIASALLGGFVGLAVLFSVTAARNRGHMPNLQPEDFYAARDQWNATGPSSYDLTVRVTGRQAAEYSVSVRNHQVFAVTRNGYPLRQQRTMGTWSVPGMFGTMSSDIANLEALRSGKADKNTPQVLLRGVFESQYGYPLRYLRTELRKFGNNQAVSWEVLQFTVVP